MQFYRKKARSMGVPIVPMIDILTILLIFFIVHTQWKKPQSLLKIDVPGAEFIDRKSTRLNSSHPSSSRMPSSA